MKRIIVFFYLISYGSTSPGAGCLDQAAWNECSEIGNIEVCSSEFGSSETRAFRGRARIRAPLKKLVPILLDVEHYKDWQTNVKGIQVVRDIVSPGETACLIERIEHSYGKKPWFTRWVFWVPDSDFVYKASYHLSPDAKQFALYMENDNSEDVPLEKNYRRGIVQSCYVLESLEDTNETLIRVEAWVELNIDIDTSSINTNLMDWPSNTINGLQNQVMNPNLNSDVKGLNVFLNQCLIDNGVN